MDTSERPMTQPPWMATSKPDFRSRQHWWAVLTLVKTAIVMPIQPQRMEVMAPTTKAMVVGTPVKKMRTTEKRTMYTAM